MKVVRGGGILENISVGETLRGAPMEVSFNLVGGVVVQAKDETGRAIASSWQGLGRPHRDSVRSMITFLHMQ